MQILKTVARFLGLSDRTLQKMSCHYRTALDSRPIKQKTVQGKLSALKRLEHEFGDRCLRDVKPVDIARLIKRIAVDEDKPVTARHVLLVARDFYTEAILLGWTNTNPAEHVKRPPAPVKRQRLTLDQWREIHAYAQKYMPSWVDPALVLALVTGQRCDDISHFRFEDVSDGHLHIEQRKTGRRIALPLALRLDVFGISLQQAIANCRSYRPPGAYMLRFGKASKRVKPASLSQRFSDARKAVGVIAEPGRLPPSFHEIRSLAERLYRAQGIDTQTLLGHKNKIMTDVYNDDRGLTKHDFKRLTL